MSGPLPAPQRVVDESLSIADFYRGAYVKCEGCNSLELADGIVCVRCSGRFSSYVPEATMRDPDVSDVVRVLQEMGVLACARSRKRRRL